MLETIFKIFKNSDDQNTENKSDDLTILCGLMIEAANTDGKLAKEEIEKIHSSLKNQGMKVGALHDHRDGTSSFYLKDTEGNWLEMLYHPSTGIPTNQ